jgi:hypothetical protein
MIEWTTASSIARAAKAGYDHRHLIQSYWVKLKAYLDYGATQVVVTGHAGAGKTLLASQMHGRARELAYQLPTESRTVEVEVFDAGRWSRLVRVLPGQDGFRSKAVLETFVSNPRLEGVIHVVDFGFVSPRDPIISKALVEQDLIDSVEKLRAKNLRFELNQLQTLLTDVRRSYDQSNCPKWIVIAVNKIDLFVDQRTEALHYYHPEGNSEFSSILQNFIADIGRNNLDIYVVESSAYEIDFHWAGTTVQSSLVRQEQNKILTEFFDSVAAIMDIKR